MESPAAEIHEDKICITKQNHMIEEKKTIVLLTHVFDVMQCVNDKGHCNIFLTHILKMRHNIHIVV